MGCSFFYSDLFPMWQSVQTENNVAKLYPSKSILKLKVKSEKV